MTLPYNGYRIECLRLGSRRGGAGMGCCAVDVIQNFNHLPESRIPGGFVQLEHGDSGVPIIDYATKEAIGLGPTNEDVFLGYLGVGTFNSSPKADKTFIAVMTESQVKSKTGAAWLKILKENGFEFVRCVNNSVYNGGGDVLDEGVTPTGHAHKNYIFALFRNISNSQVIDPFDPPAAWKELPEVTKQQVVDRYRAGYPAPGPKGAEHAKKPRAKKESIAATLEQAVGG